VKNSIKIQPSGIEFPGLENKTILESAISSNVYLEHSCMNGSCGTCKVKLLHGEVKQQGDFTSLTEDEINEGYILTCCSQVVTDIELVANYYPELALIKKTIQPCKVEELNFPSADVAILKLKLPPTAKFQFLAGQYVRLIIKGERRSYSIANISDTYSGVELHIRKVANGLFSEYIFNNLKVDQLLRLEGPVGSFFVREGDSPIIFLAGGTGFAPVKSMVEELIKQKTKRKICIYWGASTASDFYSDVANEWQNQFENITYLPVCSGVEYDGRKGLVHEAVLEDIKDISNYEVYACGSPMMIDAARNDFISKGLIPDKFHSDAFVTSD